MGNIKSKLNLMKINIPARTGFLQAFVVSIYITLVGLFMWNANSLLGQLNNFTGPILLLMLFSVSVLICGLVVFYKPYKLFFADGKKEAIETVLYTALWLFVILVFYLIGILLFKLS